MANKKNTLKKQDLNRTTTHFPLKRGIKKKEKPSDNETVPLAPVGFETLSPGQEAGELGAEEIDPEDDQGGNGHRESKQDKRQSLFHRNPFQGETHPS